MRLDTEPKSICPSPEHAIEMAIEIDSVLSLTGAGQSAVGEFTTDSEALQRCIKVVVVRRLDFQDVNLSNTSELSVADTGNNRIFVWYSLLLFPKFIPVVGRLRCFCLSEKSRRLLRGLVHVQFPFTRCNLSCFFVPASVFFYASLRLQPC